MTSPIAEPAVWIELFDLKAVDATAFRKWYDEAILLPRAALPSVQLVRRGSGVKDPVVAGATAEGMEIAVYELVDPTAAMGWLTDERPSGDASIDQVHRGGSRHAYRQLSSTLEPYEAPEAEIIHGGFFEVPTVHHTEFNAWYEQEHIAEQLKVPGYLSVRRYQGLPERNRFVALYDVSNLEVLRSPEAAAALVSAWGDRVRTSLVTSRARRLFRVQRVEQGPGGDSRG